MSEWKYTLINALISTSGVILVGLLALYGVLRQASKAYDGANRQAVALLEQAARTANATREQARWQLRRDTYAQTLIACRRYEEAVHDAGWFLADQLDEDGIVLGPFEDESHAEALGAAGEALQSQLCVLRLEGPEDNLGAKIKSLARIANALYTTLYSWSGQLHTAVETERRTPVSGAHLDDWQGGQTVLERARDDLLDAMYTVLHER